LGGGGLGGGEEKETCHPTKSVLRENQTFPPKKGKRGKGGPDQGRTQFDDKKKRGRREEKGKRRSRVGFRGGGSYQGFNTPLFGRGRGKSTPPLMRGGKKESQLLERKKTGKGRINFLIRSRGIFQGKKKKRTQGGGGKG